VAEVRTSPLPPLKGILYSDRQLQSFAHRYSRLKPIQVGDRCCHCGGDCDGEGFANASNGVSLRINGHPLCSRFSCYGARWDEFNAKRSGCNCGLRTAQ
jgi:hypothetical protein